MNLIGFSRRYTVYTIVTPRFVHPAAIFILLSHHPMLFTFLVGSEEELEQDGEPDAGVEEVPTDVVTMTQKSEASIRRKNFSRRSESSMNL